MERLKEDKEQEQRETYKLKNYEKIILHKRNKRWEYLDSWEPYFKHMTTCEICGKSVEFNSGDRITSIHFDHRNGGTEVIKGSPRNWLVHNKRTPENERVWESCNFGVLCSRCNRYLPTKDRLEWFKNFSFERLNSYINNT